MDNKCREAFIYKKEGDSMKKVNVFLLLMLVFMAMKWGIVRADIMDDIEIRREKIELIDEQGKVLLFDKEVGAYILEESTDYYIDMTIFNKTNKIYKGEIEIIFSAFSFVLDKKYINLKAKERKVIRFNLMNKEQYKILDLKVSNNCYSINFGCDTYTLSEKQKYEMDAYPLSPCRIIFGKERRMLFLEQRKKTNKKLLDQQKKHDEINKNINMKYDYYRQWDNSNGLFRNMNFLFPHFHQILVTSNGQAPTPHFLMPWINDKMNKSGDCTIGQVGCYITSATDVIQSAGMGINPRYANLFLQRNSSEYYNSAKDDILIFRYLNGFQYSWSNIGDTQNNQNKVFYISKFEDIDSPNKLFDLLTQSEDVSEVNNARTDYPIALIYYKKYNPDGTVAWPHRLVCYGYDLKEDGAYSYKDF